MWANNVGLGFGQRVGPEDRLHQRVARLELPKAPERVEKRAVDVGQPYRLERIDKLRCERMADAGENALDHLALLGSGAVERGAILGFVAEVRAYVEVFAQRRDGEHVIAPIFAR